MRKTCKKFNDSQKRDATFSTMLETIASASFLWSFYIIHGVSTIKFIKKRLKTAVNFESPFILAVVFP